MRKLNFYLPVRIIMGENCINENRQVFKDWGKKAFVVTDGIAAKNNGSLEDILDAMESQGMAHEIFENVSSDPTVECVREGAKAIQDCGADMIIAIGGGSSMDAGKAMSLLCKQLHLTDDQLVAGDFRQETIPLITVPTTSGTGSEVTPFAILTSLAARRKINMNSPEMFSRVAFLDPRYTATVPYEVGVNTGIDAISHAMEGILSAGSSPLTEAIAIEALKSISKAIKKLANDSMDGDARWDMMYGCLLAGIAVGQTRTSALHGISYPMTYHRHMPHGRAIGLLLVPYLKFTVAGDSGLVEKMLDALDMKDLNELESVMNVMLGKKDKFSKEEIAKYAAEAARLRNIQNSRVPPAEVDIIRILEAI